MRRLSVKQIVELIPKRVAAFRLRAATWELGAGHASRGSAVKHVCRTRSKRRGIWIRARGQNGRCSIHDRRDMVD